MPGTAGVSPQNVWICYEKTFDNNVTIIAWEIILIIGGENVMGRKDRETGNVKDIKEIIHRANICRLAMCEGGRPYIVPLCFGYEGGKLYFHSASKGRKLEILEDNRNVCFEMDVDQELVSEEIPCKWGFRYRSVVGFGKASFIRDPESKRKALRIIMGNYSEGVFDFTESEVSEVTMIKVDVEDMKGKVSGY